MGEELSQAGHVKFIVVMQSTCYPIGLSASTPCIFRLLTKLSIFILPPDAIHWIKLRIAIRSRSLSISFVVCSEMPACFAFIE